MTDTLAKLTFRFMETCYQTCCFGNMEPTHIVMSVARREELRRLIAPTPRVPQDWITMNGKLGYNNAVVIGLPEFPESYIWMTSVERPDLEGLSQRFMVEG